jgi:membrane protease YdiL (CAAX protease family)
MKRIRALADAGGVAAGMILFALFSHQSFPLGLIGAAGIVVAGASIVWSGFGTDTPFRTLGLDSFSLRTAFACVLGGTLGVLAGFLHRNSLGLPAQPSQSVESFVLVACVIGMTEELIYRGWLFGRIRSAGWPLAVAVAAAAVAHGAYKTALFVWPGVPAAVNLPTILVGTIAGGLLLGLLRASTGSLVPALIAHAAFDFVVYRAVASAPWWVWQ